MSLYMGAGLIVSLYEIVSLYMGAGLIVSLYENQAYPVIVWNQAYSVTVWEPGFILSLYGNHAGLSLYRIPCMLLDSRNRKIGHWIGHYNYVIGQCPFQNLCCKATCKGLYY